jgi:hypothetical protein
MNRGQKKIAEDIGKLLLDIGKIILASIAFAGILRENVQAVDLVLVGTGMSIVFMLAGMFILFYSRD